MLELTTQSRKRKIKDDNNFSEFYKPSKKRKTEEEDEDIEYGAILNSLVSSKKRKPRAPNGVRNKKWWENFYRRWSGKDFKKDFQVKRATFSFNVAVIGPYMFKEHYSYFRTTHLVHLSSSSLYGCWLGS